MHVCNIHTQIAFYIQVSATFGIEQMFLPPHILMDY